VLLLEDTEGRGHASRVGSTDLLLAVVQPPKAVSERKARGEGPA